MNYPTLIGVVNQHGNVDIKMTTGSRTPVKQMNCQGKAVAVIELTQENGRVDKVYVQCNDGVVRVYDRSGSCIQMR
jgi:hypothetical protein